MGYNVATHEEVVALTADAVVRARIDGHIKEEAAAIYQAMGLTVSDAVRMMLIRTVADRALPFDPLVPNETTIEAMKAVRRGELAASDSVDALLAELHEDAQPHRPVQEGLQAQKQGSPPTRSE